MEKRGAWWRRGESGGEEGSLVEKRGAWWRSRELWRRGELGGEEGSCGEEGSFVERRGAVEKRGEAKASHSPAGLQFQASSLQLIRI